MTARTPWNPDNDALATLELRRSSKYFAGGLLLIALALFSSGCQRESASTPAEMLVGKSASTPATMLVGKWHITSKEAFETVLPGDGSYLEFDACSDDECTGTDHLASRPDSGPTTGSITYDLAADGKTITITDTTADGGMFRGTWTIHELDETKLRIGIYAGELGVIVINLERVH